METFDVANNFPQKLNQRGFYFFLLLQVQPFFYVVVNYDNVTPSIETHLAVVRVLPIKKFQTECVNEKSSTERRS